MFSRQVWSKLGPAVFVSGLTLLCILPNLTATRDVVFAHFSQPAQENVPPVPVSLTFLRVFSSAEDVRPSHPILDRSLDIIAGPADPHTRVDALQSPSAVTTTRSTVSSWPIPALRRCTSSILFTRDTAVWRDEATACRIPSRSPWMVKTIYMWATRTMETYSSTTRQESFAIILED